MFSHKTDRLKFYDISLPIRSEMPVFPGDPGVAVSQVFATSRGDLANVSSICMGTHTGTHIDAPYHINSNLPALQDLDLGVMLGPATVFQLDATGAITAQDIAGLPWDGVTRALFKTRNSQLYDETFHENYVHIADDAARFLVQNTSIRMIGFDYLSVERFGAEQLMVHAELLGHGIAILEGLNLSGVAAGEYDLVCLPLNLIALDGAPARAILIG